MPSGPSTGSSATTEKLRDLQGIYDRWNAEQAKPLAPLERPGSGFEKAVQKKSAAR
jgi:hypothetical protein